MLMKGTNYKDRFEPKLVIKAPNKKVLQEAAQRRLDGKQGKR